MLAVEGAVMPAAPSGADGSDEDDAGDDSSVLPPLYDLEDPALKPAHKFSEKANWLIPERVMCGHYPGSCPSRPMNAAHTSFRMERIQGYGINTFVCLMEELPPQDQPWPEEGYPKSGAISNRAPLATGNFYNYRKHAAPGAKLSPDYA